MELTLRIVLYGQFDLPTYSAPRMQKFLFAILDMKHAVFFPVQLGSFSTTKHYLFPVWLAAILIAAVYLESRKQLGHFFKEGSAHVCSFVTVINEGFAGAQQAAKSERLIPRTGDQEIYTVMEFNDKVGA